MSVQVKRKFEELVTYLGKDTKGLEKVKQLKDAVNELRKRLAAAEEKLEQMEAVKDAARERADKAEAAQAATAQARAAAEAETQNLAYKLSQIALQKRTRETEIEETRLKLISRLSDNEQHDATVAEMLQVLQRVREHMPDCVSPVGTFRITDIPVRIFDRQQLAVGWDDAALWQLGAAVGLLSVIYGVVTVVSAVPTDSSARPTSVADLATELTYSTRLNGWVAKNAGSAEEHFAALDRMSGRRR